MNLVIHQKERYFTLLRYEIIYFAENHLTQLNKQRNIFLLVSGS